MRFNSEDDYEFEQVMKRMDSAIWAIDVRRHGGDPDNPPSMYRIGVFGKPHPELNK